MTVLKTAALAVALLAGVSAANAATIVNLSADPVHPNSGLNSGSYAPNPVSLTLGAGTYSVGVVGIAGGGLYDAYTVYAPTGTNLAYTDGAWSVLVDGATQTQQSTTRFTTAAGALNYYSALAPLTFTVAATTTVEFFALDDAAFPYFGDDSGGVSLAVKQVPEPASLALLGAGMAALGMVRRRRTAA